MFAICSNEHETGRQSAPSGNWRLALRLRAVRTKVALGLLNRRVQGFHQVGTDLAAIAGDAAMDHRLHGLDMRLDDLEVIVPHAGARHGEIIQ